MKPEASFTEGIYTVDLFRDDDCSNPREDDGHFLWLGFPHRRYDIGDEQIDPSTFSEDCPNEKCDGGRIYPVEDDYSTYDTCPTCQGDAEIRPHNLAELIDMVLRKYEAVQVEPVGMIDHSGVAYYLGGGAHSCDPGGWDSGTCGLMVYTRKQSEEWGCGTDPDEIRQQMRNELEEYISWAAGDCWGYEVRLSDDYEPSNEDCLGWQAAVASGDCTSGFLQWLAEKHYPDDTCWGFIGMEYAEREAKDALHLHAKQGATA